MADSNHLVPSCRRLTLLVKAIESARQSHGQDHSGSPLPGHSGTIPEFDDRYPPPSGVS